jgi:hypothetical protein
MAVAGDGTTIYVAAISDAASRLVYKSTNSGVSWSDLSRSSGLDIAKTDLIAVAPDNPDIAIVAAKVAPAAYVTTDGGHTWASLGTISGSGPAAAIYDIDISAPSGDARYVAAAGTTSPGDHNSPALFYFNLGNVVAGWRDAVHDFAAQGGENLDVSEIDAIRAVAFSPTFSADLTAVVVSEQIGTAAKDGAVRFHMVSFASHEWDSPAGFAGYPVALASSHSIGFSVGHASISLSPDYQAADDSQRLAFVGTQVADSTHNLELGGIYRLNDTASVKIRDAPIYSVAFDGTDLVAGATTSAAGVASNAVYYCQNPQSDAPLVNVTSDLKRPGGTTAVIVAWAGDVVVAGTSGSNSAFSISENDGQSFNDISLIDAG